MLASFIIERKQNLHLRMDKHFGRCVMDPGEVAWPGGPSRGLGNPPKEGPIGSISLVLLCPTYKCLKYK